MPVSPAQARPLPGVSIVLPAYNEEDNVEAAVRQALEVMEELALPHEVMVVDDGSTDRTAELARGLMAGDAPRVRVLRHPHNQGYGAALRTGFAHARHELLFFTDCDLQFHPGELKYFLPLMGEHDMAIGFRVYRYDTVLRSIVSWIYNRLVGVLFRLRVRDVDCAFKVMRREVVEQVGLECDNFFISTELVARARKWRFRIIEKGVRHYPRVAGETTVRPSDVPRTFKEIGRMWQRIYLPTRRQLDARAAREQRRLEAVAEVEAPVRA